MTYVIEAAVTSDTAPAWASRNDVGTMSNTSKGGRPTARIAHGAVAFSAIASVAFPLPAIAGRPKFDAVEQGIFLAEGEPIPSSDLVEDCYVYRTSSEINSTVLDNSGVVYKLKDGAVTVHQRRSEKNASTTISSGVASGTPPHVPSIRRSIARSDATSDVVRGLFSGIRAQVLDVYYQDPILEAIEKVSDPALNGDARLFAKTLVDLPWQPDVWSGDGEVVFEWISDDRHAVVSIEGDGLLGYTLLRDGQFQSGQQNDALVTALPEDLKEYITTRA